MWDACVISQVVCAEYTSRGLAPQRRDTSANIGGGQRVPTPMIGLGEGVRHLAPEAPSCRVMGCTDEKEKTCRWRVTKKGVGHAHSQPGTLWPCSPSASCATPGVRETGPWLLGARCTERDAAACRLDHAFSVDDVQTYRQRMRRRCGGDAPEQPDGIKALFSRAGRPGQTRARTVRSWGPER